MSWTYHQATGELDHNGKRVATGYAGKRPWQNQPQFQSLPKKGPLPQGKYVIGPPFHDKHTGVYSLRLTPDMHNQMFGRSLFLIHGANSKHPDDSSDGCIVIAPWVRHAIAASGDRVLEVVP